MAVVRDTEDHQEGVRAFKEKGPRVSRPLMAARRLRFGIKVAQMEGAYAERREGGPRPTASGSTPPGPTTTC